MGKRIALAFCIGLSSAVGFSQDPWVLEANPVDPRNYAGVTIANGQIGVVSSPNPLQVKEIVMAGAYDTYGRGMVSNMLRSFNMLNAFVELDGHRVSAPNVSEMKQQLNMRQSYFRSSFFFEKGAKISVSYRALRHLPFSTLMEIEITPTRDAELRLGSIMSAPDALREVQQDFTEIVIPETTLPLLTSTAKSPSGKLLLTACNAFIFEEEPGQEPRVHHEMWDNNMHQIFFHKKLKKGETYKVAIVSSQVTSSHRADPYNEAQRLTIFASLQGSKMLIADHEEAWEKLWKTGRIELEGDLQVQQDLNNMVYHLYSFVRSYSANSLSPMGLSGLGYNGHVFWDAEIWMYPPILLLQPQLAKSMVEYRYDRLAAAKINANDHGFDGAMFPWESAASGEEETPIWALSGPFEHHISACVGMAAWQYFCVTQDTSWLKNKGWPLLKETATFWKSRVTKNKNGDYEIRNVVGADEWAENIDNDAWTNAATKANLRYATSAAYVIDVDPDPEWSVIADALVIEQMPNGVTKEHSSYVGEPIKQADVNLLAYPLAQVSDSRQVIKDLEYYKKRVSSLNTPAMTKSIFALLYARHGDIEKAYETFKDGYQPNMWGPFRVIMETPGSYNPYFATGAGGVLQAMMMGFGGLKITDMGVLQDAGKLPKAWHSLKLIGVGRDEKTFFVGN
ncbi:MAG: glycoside hydrolase family 65 protein [Cyclobacteriaceae bacterium]|nr:glycoside hydrolase family 65 protein [Cyclobacteriaceae bacterium HetDA_MAG_MS6]